MKHQGGIRQRRGNVLATTDDDWAKTFDVN
jgi:hypothetical protein